MLTGSPSRALLFFSPDLARPAPAFSIDPTDQEPGTGLLKFTTVQVYFIHQAKVSQLQKKYGSKITSHSLLV